MQIITKSLHGRITKHESDYMGRWTYVTFATKRSNLIFVINIYKPCKASIHKAGPMTVYRQQWTTLRQQGIQTPDPREQFDKDLLVLLHSIQEQQHQIILIGDFNEPKSKSKLLEKLYSMGLRDMVSDRHRNLPNFRTYFRGTTAIDYGLCSMSLLPHITLSTYEPFSTTTHSDHRGIIIDFHSKTLLGKQHHLTTPTTRGLHSTNEKQTKKFLQYLAKYWTDYNIEDRIHQAANPSLPNKNYVNSSTKLMTTSQGFYSKQKNVLHSRIDPHGPRN